jgi:magnesium chelatase family protein
LDLVCELSAVPSRELADVAAPRGESRTIRRRVEKARELQRVRLRGTHALCNGDMDGRLTRHCVPIPPAVVARLGAAQQHARLSGRGHDRVLRVARTIADLEGVEEVAPRHVDEALGYRLDAWEPIAA